MEIGQKATIAAPNTLLSQTKGKSGSKAKGKSRVKAKGKDKGSIAEQISAHEISNTTKRLQNLAQSTDTTTKISTKNWR